MATWPAEVRALAPRLYGVGIPARRLFGPWLFWDVVPSLQLAGALSTRAFRALTTRTIRTAGGDASNFGTHSVRRAAGGALVHAGVPRSLVTQALRPASARSDESYILESAKLTAVAAAPRMPPSGRTAGAAAKPGGRLDELAGPLAEGLGLRPAEAPQHGSPMGARMAGGVAPVGGFEQPADGSLRRLWLGPQAARLLTDEQLAAMFCRMSALPSGTVPSGMWTSLTARCPPRFRPPAQPWPPLSPLPGAGRRPGAPGHNAGGHRLRHQVGPRRHRAHAQPVPRARLSGGPGLPHPGPRAPALSTGPHGRPPRALRAHRDRAGPGL